MTPESPGVLVFDDVSAVSASLTAPASKDARVELEAALEPIEPVEAEDPVAATNAVDGLALQWVKDAATNGAVAHIRRRADPCAAVEWFIACFGGFVVRMFI